MKLDPVLDGPAKESKTESKTKSTGDPKIYTNRQNETYTGMPIVPLDPNVASSGPTATFSTATGSTGTTDKSGVTDKVWKDTPLDDISRSGAPGAGPSAPAHVTAAVPNSTSSGLGSTTTTGTDSAIKTSGPNSVTATSETYNPAATSKVSDVHGVSAAKDSRTTAENTPSTTENRDTPSWATTDVPSTTGTSTSIAGTQSKGTWAQKAGHLLNSADGVAGLATEHESYKSPELATTTSHEEKDGKMSHLKEKLKNKLHIGSKDK